MDKTYTAPQLLGKLLKVLEVNRRSLAGQDSYPDMQDVCLAAHQDIWRVDRLIRWIPSHLDREVVDIAIISAHKRINTQLDERATECSAEREIEQRLSRLEQREERANRLY